MQHSDLTKRSLIETTISLHVAWNVWRCRNATISRSRLSCQVFAARWFFSLLEVCSNLKKEILGLLFQELNLTASGFLDSLRESMPSLCGLFHLAVPMIDSFAVSFSLPQLHEHLDFRKTSQNIGTQTSATLLLCLPFELSRLANALCSNPPFPGISALELEVSLVELLESNDLRLRVDAWRKMPTLYSPLVPLKQCSKL